VSWWWNQTRVSKQPSQPAKTGPRNCASQHFDTHAGSASFPNQQSISSLLAMSAARAFSTALRAGAPRAPIAARVAGIRGYAAAAPGPASKPPVALFGVDGTYASALVRLLGAQLGAWKMLGDGISRQWLGTKLGLTDRTVHRSCENQRP
jgi:hypothetical protein